MTTDDSGAPEANTSTVLSIGLHPSAVDYSKHPGIDEATLTARIAAGTALLREAGFDVSTCQVSADPDAAEAVVREHLGAGTFRVAMIGAGVRTAVEHTLLFERLVNVLLEATPGIRLCFNSSPETTVDALRRWVRPTAARA
ncbi:hypothetical protein [Nocardia bovistercoris]|uniref:Uncharacterized protein n=1 Tax=Nocardia bovistercoris TaxID=2785916 RepID=A0A931IGG4_9NOCA|nr:hypothetical protein [Nocardia bovistercoris]MBH0780133.1 hypothetical protein [Nocardia bovistercoris]